MSLVLYKTKCFLSLTFFSAQTVYSLCVCVCFFLLVASTSPPFHCCQIILKQDKAVEPVQSLCMLQINTDSLSWRMNWMFVWVFAGEPVRGGPSAEAEGGVVRPDPWPQPACWSRIWFVTRPQETTSPTGESGQREITRNHYTHCQNTAAATGALESHKLKIQICLYLCCLYDLVSLFFPGRSTCAPRWRWRGWSRSIRKSWRIKRRS